jgi:hypothetical protein
VHIVGNGINEAFRSDEQGRIAVELPVGDYTARVSAVGYREQEVSFRVQPDFGARLDARLTKG